jgi:hypothetical protein
MTEKTIAELLLEIFGGNEYHAQSRVAGNGDIYYAPIESPMTMELLDDHLDGHITLGSYQLISGANVVRFLGWDIDSTDPKTARDQTLLITKHLKEIPHVVEFSGGKGYHVLIFLKEPMPATEAKKIVEWIREKEGLAASGSSHVECFPKQDRLSKAKPKGNLLKIPLGAHPRSHAMSAFVDPDNGWEGGRIVDPLEALLDKASLDDVYGLVSEAGPPPDMQLTSLLAEYWTDGKRHDLALYLSGFLAHEGWGEEQAKTLMTNICNVVGDTEAYNRLQTVENTFAKHREGKGVRGRQGLGEILPVTSMQKLTELVSLICAPDTVSQIDDIRYAKGRPTLESARLANNTIWSILNDEGSRIFQTYGKVAYWYNSEDHTVVEEGTEMWKTMLNKRFGFNPNDAFSKLVYAELRLRIVREAPFVPIQHRTYWAEDTGKLYINLGGPDVYILDGKDVYKAYNGECGYMFITNESGKFMYPDFDAEPVNVFEFLVDDLSFTQSADAPANPEEQKELLKAWMLAFFFQELMPTKPILAMLGAPGSGKTTAIRRILRVFEEPDADVLSVQTDKQDAFRASIESHRLLAMDNLEKSGAGWMVDTLNKLATGGNIELRELYKTNAKHVIVPRCFVAITAVNMPFSDETLFSRLLVLEMQKLENPLPEHFLQKRIRENEPAIWADLMKKLNVVVSSVRKAKTIKAPTKSRLVDFTVFCARISDCGVVNGETLNLGLLAMVDSQMRQLKESSQAIQVLELWLQDRPGEANQWNTYKSIYGYLSAIAQQRKMDFRWKTWLALARHFQSLEARLRSDYGADFKNDGDSDEGKRVRFTNVVQMVGPNMEVNLERSSR